MTNPLLRRADDLRIEIKRVEEEMRQAESPQAAHLAAIRRAGLQAELNAIIPPATEPLPPI